MTDKKKTIIDMYYTFLLPSIRSIEIIIHINPIFFLFFFFDYRDILFFKGKMEAKMKQVTHKDVRFLIEVVEQLDREQNRLLQENKKMEQKIKEMELTIHQLHDYIEYYVDYIKNMWNAFQFHRLEFWQKKENVNVFKSNEPPSEKKTIKLVPPGMMIVKQKQH